MLLIQDSLPGNGATDEPIGSRSTTSIAESTKPTGPDTGLDAATSAAGDISALFFGGALVAFSAADSSTRSTGYDTGSDEFIETGSTAGVTTVAEPHFYLYLSLQHK
ncbi:hypothetical protein MRB53_036551 [Persea americana]|jgi:hypothetical protein|nr:hypothetical protein MRB53_037476 [Persea americana]KAJ8613871.1 hypothetical protein MRB53_036828 [Persea americana]KAJ8614685.1 hypothetical protein MRB53_036551 [Persea americana]